MGHIGKKCNRDPICMLCEGNEEQGVPHKASPKLLTHPCLEVHSQWPNYWWNGEVSSRQGAHHRVQWFEWFKGRYVGPISYKRRKHIRKFAKISNWQSCIAIGNVSWSSMAGVIPLGTVYRILMVWVKSRSFLQITYPTLLLKTIQYLFHQRKRGADNFQGYMNVTTI